MDEQAAQALSAAFPAPPPYWRSFTSTNLERIAELRATQSQSSKNYNAATELPLRLLDLPPELRWLQPPQPSEGTYKCFGDSFDLTARRPSLGDVEQLYTPPRSPTPSGIERHIDRAFILKKLAKSLLLNFLELVGIMDISIEQFAEKNADLNTLFLNFHHLLNEYRPHQARESLILMMQDQVDRIRAETQANLEITAKGNNILEGLGQAKLADEKGSEKTKWEESDGQDVWEELRGEFQ